jgi:hypothetical protein
MKDEFEWKAEITFKGSPAEYEKLVAVLNDISKAGSVTFQIPEWTRRRGHTAGCFPSPIDRWLDERILTEITEGMPRFAINYVRGIPGGIRTPHLHLQDEVVLLDRAKFKIMAQNVAAAIASRRVDALGDYVAVMNEINALGALP